MARPWSERFAVATIALAFGVDASCSSEPYGPKAGRTRTLDDTCRSGGCMLSGSAVMVSGPTPDTLGIRMGPGESSATIVIAVGYFENEPWHIELLASGNGTFSVSGPSCAGAGGGLTFQPPADYGWVSIGGCSGANPQVQTKATVTITGTGGATMDIADVRTYGFPVQGC